MGRGILESEVDEQTGGGDLEAWAMLEQISQPVAVGREPLDVPAIIEMCQTPALRLPRSTRDPWRDRAAGIGAVLLDARPRICGLQEVWADDGVNLAGELAAELGMSWAWNPSSCVERWQAACSRAGLCPRWPSAGRTRSN